MLPVTFMSTTAPPPCVLVLSPFADDALAPVRAQARVVRSAELADLPAFLRDQGADVRAVITNGMLGVPAGCREHLTSLRLVACNGVGYDAVDLDWARAHGIAVSNTPDVLSADVADLALGLMLAVFRQLVLADQHVRSRAWAQGPLPLGRRLAGSRVGIVGLGRIGRLIARRCEGFDMPVGYHGRHRQPDVAYDYFDDVAALARWADVLVLATPGGAATQGLVDAAVLEALGPTGVLINIARGSVVDESALCEALRVGAIAGAGLDVFQAEPRVPDALLALPQVVLSPHIASATVQTRQAMAELVVANVIASLRGEPLPTPVP